MPYFVGNDGLGIVPVGSSFFQDGVTLPGFNVLIGFATPSGLNGFPITIVVMLCARIYFLYVLHLERGGPRVGLNALFGHAGQQAVMGFS